MAGGTEPVVVSVAVGAAVAVVAAVVVLGLAAADHSAAGMVAAVVAAAVVVVAAGRPVAVGADHTPGGRRAGVAVGLAGAVEGAGRRRPAHILADSRG